jgi:hypothetical protein
MTFCKLLYLLEALFSTNSETVCYGHITGEVTNSPILLNGLNFVPVTVSNLVKLYPVNCFVLRLHTVSTVSLTAFLGQSRFSERVLGGSS